ncbi:MAG: phage terminase small subunit [Ewingella americana]|jgi:tetratricopeptide (TPR) repeat protein|uniref:phage terminase small subunit n=1 Tax=Ewingella americana TaxID=41202 RepID=UPI002432D366|nr:phage terminase small subunit [Ewingella americana]MCI1680042.1 phage terminase small subunit [Ewingella americana]MCI1855037.1 phage terminase small subunit [Ewingella americana]MCI1863514.1 phage terminase small subunit [Ewingella americana]MCI2143384.1 phage terminase small subunit [Ewingella americana]MCI2164541.1 phage terminase small subunit [Ewingella americana]
MSSPARSHFLRQSAIEAAQQENGLLRHATGYELQLRKLNEDKARLKQVKSNETKAELKRTMLPAYAPWVAGVLAEGKGAQDAILMTVMVWRLDAGDIAGALEIAQYALKHKLATPDDFTRPTGYLLAEEVTVQALRNMAAGETVEIEPLLNTLELTDGEDMPDLVRAKLHKVIGTVYRSLGRAGLALQHMKRALQLDESSGVKKSIEQLEREIKKASGS